MGADVEEAKDLVAEFHKETEVSRQRRALAQIKRDARSTFGFGKTLGMRSTQITLGQDSGSSNAFGATQLNRGSNLFARGRNSHGGTVHSGSLRVPVRLNNDSRN